MGLIQAKIKEEQERRQGGAKQQNNFPDLNILPPELALSVLSHLNATDLSLAACVWQELALDDLLWQGLCKAQWKYASIYSRADNSSTSYRRLYLALDEATLTFNNDSFNGMKYLFDMDLLDDDPQEIAKFFYGTKMLNPCQVRYYLDTRREILDLISSLFPFKNVSLPDALRNFFKHLGAPNNRGNYLQILLRKFSSRYCKCNPQLALNSDTILILCYSLIMLSVDLCSPHVKNKMSKREFIRNVRNALRQPLDDLCGHLYDDIYLRGHVVSSS